VIAGCPVWFHTGVNALDDEVPEGARAQEGNAAGDGEQQQGGEANAQEWRATGAQRGERDGDEASEHKAGRLCGAGQAEAHRIVLLE